MNHKPYLESVKKQFSFLNERYGFAGPNQFSDDNDPQGYGQYVLIKYHSAWTIVTIERERDNALSVRIAPVTEEKGLAIEWIVEFFTGGTRAINLEPYTAPEKTGWTLQEFYEVSHAYRAGRDIIQHGNKVVGEIMKELERREAWEEYRLAIYASTMQQYCEPLLRGDFSEWHKIREYVDQKIEDRIRTLTKDKISK